MKTKETLKVIITEAYDDEQAISMICKILGLENPFAKKIADVVALGQDQDECLVEEEDSESLESPPRNEPKPKRDTSNTKDEKPKSKQKIDRGKVLALHRAGRSAKWIADDMSISVGSVYAILKEAKSEKN